MITPEKVKTYYDTHDLEEHANVLQPLFKNFLEQERSFVENMMQEKNIVLEIGCGYGRVMNYLKENMCITGIDNSEQTIAKDLREGQKIIEEVINPYRKKIVESNTTIFNDFMQFPRYYLHDEKKKIIWSTSSFKPYNFDYDDLRILDKIAENARKSIVAIAQELSIPATTAAYRIKQLEKQGVIVAYRALIDFQKLDMTYYKIDLTLEDINIIPALQEFCMQHPNIIYRDVTVGGSDFEFDAELPNQETFYQMIEEIKKTFPDIVRSFHYYKAIKIYKYSYFPKKLLTFKH